GYESVDMVDSELGRIRNGWNVSAVGDVAENYDRLRKPLSKMQRANMSGQYPYYGAAKVIAYVAEYLFVGEYHLVGEDGSVATTQGYPVLQLVNSKFWANNHTHILQGSIVSTRYLYLALSQIPVTGYITGTAQPKITQAALRRVPIVVPSAEIAAR